MLAYHKQLEDWIWSLRRASVVAFPDKIALVRVRRRAAIPGVLRAAPGAGVVHRNAEFRPGIAVEVKVAVGGWAKRDQK